MLWFKALRGHLKTHIAPISANSDITVTHQSLQDSVIVALTSIAQPLSTLSAATASPGKAGNNLLPLDSEIVTVKRLLGVKRSFRVCLQPQASGGAVEGDGMVAIYSMQHAKCGQHTH